MPEQRILIPDAAFINIDYNGWHIDGTIMEWDYSILDQSGYLIARVNKELFHMTDIYVIDVQDPGNALDALMLYLRLMQKNVLGIR